MVRLSNLTKSIIRRTVGEMLTEAVVIKRYTDSLDTYGAPVRALASSVSTTGYLTDAAGGANVAMVADEDVSEVTYLLTVPYNADIVDGDVVTVGGRDYRVRRVIIDHSNDVLRRVWVVRIGE